jgi:hypothetical protein
MATSRSIQRVKAKVAKRTARTKRAAEKKGQDLANEGRKAVRASSTKVRKVAKMTAKKASGGSKEAHTKARKAGAAIGRLLGRAQSMSKRLVNKARKKLS